MKKKNPLALKVVPSPPLPPLWLSPVLVVNSPQEPFYLSIISIPIQPKESAVFLLLLP